MRVEDFLEHSARRAPHKTALVCQGSRLTYGELDRLSDRLADSLTAHGVQRGDRVVIFLDNSVEAVVAVFAVLKAGAVFVMTNSSMKAEKLAYIANNSEAVGLISHARLEPVFAGIEHCSPALRVIITAGSNRQAAIDNRVTALSWDEALLPGGLHRGNPGIDIDLATIIYTSGSTGFPKGVMMTHLNMVTAASSITQYLENVPDDVILNVLPLSFDYGLYQILMGLKIGGTVVLEKSFAYPQQILDLLRDEKVTGLPIVPTMAAILLQIKALTPGQFPSLRYITNTAATLPPAHISQLQRLFPSARIFSMYGLTECKRAAYLPPDQLGVRPASVGKAIPNTEVYIVDGQGEKVGPGVIGELVIRGAHVMKGYWKRPEETDWALRPGPLPGEKVLFTGDLFKTDAEGYLYFVGRKDDAIKSRGEKVSPTEIENVLYGIPDVLEAAVVGVPDEILGQAIKAVIVLRDGSSLTENEILLHCRSHLEDFMVPQSVELTRTLPKTDTGKIRRRGLSIESNR